MRAATIRRMIVFGVCALGVGSLYLVPSLARSPDQIGLQPVSDEPTGSPAGGPTGEGRQAAPTGTDRTARWAGRETGGALDDAPPTTQPTFDNKQRGP